MAGDHHGTRPVTRHRGQRGMVTAELAVGVLVAVFLAALACFTVGLVTTQSRCASVATEVARQLARGDQAAADRARDAAPAGASVTTTRHEALVEVVVSTDRSFGRVGPVHLAGRATAAVEPGVAR